jgi:hypothetical protein
LVRIGQTLGRIGALADGCVAHPTAARLVLVVCETGAPPPAPGNDDARDGIYYAGIADIGARLIETLCPDVIVSPLITRSFDCIDLAQLLETLGYRGAYCAVTRALPRPEMIRTEIRALCPRLRFDLTFIDAA